MKKKILVIGGSYFIGRMFMLRAARSEEYEFHVVNRGSFPLSLVGVTEHVCDRRDSSALAALFPETRWDVIVDFCAEEPGDIASLLGALAGGSRHYIYISTCSVYEPSAPSPKSEDAPKLQGGGNDPGLIYAYQKLLLEREAAEACASSSIPLTSSGRPLFTGRSTMPPGNGCIFNASSTRSPYRRPRTPPAVSSSCM